MLISRAPKGKDTAIDIKLAFVQSSQKLPNTLTLLLILCLLTASDQELSINAYLQHGIPFLFWHRNVVQCSFLT